MSAASAVVAVGSFDWPPPQAATVARTAISTAVIAANFIFDFMVQIRQVFSGQASACLGGMRRDSVQSARNHDLPKRVAGGAVSVWPCRTGVRALAALSTFALRQPIGRLRTTSNAGFRVRYKRRPSFCATARSRSSEFFALTVELGTTPITPQKWGLRMAGFARFSEGKSRFGSTKNVVIAAFPVALTRNRHISLL